MTAEQLPAVALVTGGARGIGAAIAKRWVGAGGHAVLADLDTAAGERVAAELGERARFVRADVTEESDVRAAFELAAQADRPLTAVFANAGAVGVTGSIAQTQLEAWRSTVDLLLTSVFLTVKHGVAAMRPGGTGALVCTASVASVRGGLGPHAYTAAKAGVRGLVESVAVEVAPHGLRINAVAPAGTVTSLAAGLVSGDVDDLDTAHGRLAAGSSSGVPTTAEDVADAALFLASPRASRVNGATLIVDGGDAVLGTAGRQFYG